MAPTIWHPGPDKHDALLARPYGTGLNDLVVEFDNPLNAVISAMLAECISDSDGSVFDITDIEQWTLAKRRQALLAVAVATNGRSRWLTTDCSACDEKLDLDIDLDNFRQDWRVEEIEFRETKLRLPRPDDLLAADIDDHKLACALLVGDPPSGEWVAEAESALDSADALANLELQSSCPACDALMIMPLVLESYLIDELAREATRLLDEIHVLALAYHWSESEIIALPESRRRHYLARVTEAWAA